MIKKKYTMHYKSQDSGFKKLDIGVEPFRCKVTKQNSSLKHNPSLCPRNRSETSIQEICN